MECRDVREMADSFLAEELLTETNHEILRHLDTCPVCRTDLDGRRALREGMQRAFHRAPNLGPSPEFAARLRTTLQNTAQQTPARRGARFPGWWALAATVLLAVALGLAYRGRIAATGALARAAVGDHRNCALQFRLAEKPISLEDAAQQFGTRTVSSRNCRQTMSPRLLVQPTSWSGTPAYTTGGGSLTSSSGIAASPCPCS